MSCQSRCGNPLGPPRRAGELRDPARNHARAGRVERGRPGALQSPPQASSRAAGTRRQLWLHCALQMWPLWPPQQQPVACCPCRHHRAPGPPLKLHYGSLRPARPSQRECAILQRPPVGSPRPPKTRPRKKQVWRCWWARPAGLALLPCEGAGARSTSAPCAASTRCPPPLGPPLRRLPASRPLGRPRRRHCVGHLPQMCAPGRPLVGRGGRARTARPQPSARRSP
mmetsp:Transcript_55049/g.118138  ORF Transcript_55049/g.118138 Transcript_55049/m.118138 type:complete len:226 (-) Transcript_55049:169-846(-)